MIDQSIGINRGLMTTIHRYTGDQRILDNNTAICAAPLQP